jgi:hypothetical protein
MMVGVGCFTHLRVEHAMQLCPSDHLHPPAYWTAGVLAMACLDVANIVVVPASTHSHVQEMTCCPAK